MAKKTVRRAVVGASVAEVLDRILDRGIVIDAWMRVSLAGIGLIEVDAQIVVASIQTYVRESDALARPPARADAGRPRAPRTTRPRRRAPRRVRAPRPSVTLQCAQGCTVARSATRPPAIVRCPSDRRQTCNVSILTPAE
jgi:hypothetical protein